MKKPNPIMVMDLRSEALTLRKGLANDIADNLEH